MTPATNETIVLLTSLNGMLLLIVGYFLRGILSKIESIATDVHKMQIIAAVKDEEVKTIKERLTHLENQILN